jgi:hypothetical protein
MKLGQLMVVSGTLRILLLLAYLEVCHFILNLGSGESMLTDLIGKFIVHDLEGLNSDICDIN